MKKACIQGRRTKNTTRSAILKRVGCGTRSLSGIVEHRSIGAASDAATALLAANRRTSVSDTARLHEYWSDDDADDVRAALFVVGAVEVLRESLRNSRGGVILRK